MEFNVHFFSFSLEIPFWANLIQKIKIVLLSWNLNMQNYVVLTFSILDQRNLFCANLFKKNHSCQFKPKFATKANLNMGNSMMMFTFSVFFNINIFLGWISSKNLKLFKVKFDRNSNSKMLNSMVMSILSVLDWE